MRRRIDKHLGQSNTEGKSYDPVKDPKDTLVTPLKPSNEYAELEQVNVLYSFLENRYSKKVSLKTPIQDSRL